MEWPGEMAVETLSDKESGTNGKIQRYRWLGAYSLTHLRRDLVAGLTVATVAVPQAMAYALIAGIPPQYGLYTAIVMTALGSIFGSSRFLINGPTNAISLVVFGAVATLSTNADDSLRMDHVCLLAVLVGLIQIAIALLKLGDLTRYISESVILGFMAGAGALVALTQVDRLLGLRSIGSNTDHLLVRLWRTWTEGGPVNYWALAIGLTTLVIIFALHRLSARIKVKLPELLLSLTVVSLLVWLFDVAHSDGQIAHLDVERSLPLFRVPGFDYAAIRELWGGALAIALLGLVEALAIAKSIAARTREPFDYNRQCLAEGIANLGGGFFRCMPGSGSLTRSAINYFSGAATRMSGIFSALAVTAALLAFAPLAHYIPQPALAGVLIWTAWRIVDRPRLWFCLRATRFDGGLAIATAAAAVFISIEFSILIGTFLSFLFFVPRAARLKANELVVGSDRLVRERRPDDPVCEKTVLLDVEGELFFGAAPELDEQFAELRRRVARGARIIVLRLKRTRNADMVCLERLQNFIKGMHECNATVLLCGVRPDLAAAMHNLRFDRWLPPECVFLEEATPGSSTLAAVRHAYVLLGQDLCNYCPRRQDMPNHQPDWYYVI
jgi:SulP family sulfate permease